MSLSDTEVASQPPFSEPESSPQEALREAAKKLKERIEKSGIDSTQFGLDPIHGSYDINSLARSLELALDKLMEKTKVPDATQNVAKAFTKEWAKKSLPFLEKGLSTAQVYFLNDRLAEYLGCCTCTLQSYRIRGPFDRKGIEGVSFGADL